MGERQIEIEFNKFVFEVAGGLAGPAGDDKQICQVVMDAGTPRGNSGCLNTGRYLAPPLSGVILDFDGPRSTIFAVRSYKSSARINTTWR